MAKQGFYAVRQGRQPGIYSTWTECQANVQGFSGAVYKKFNTYEEAQSFCASGSISSSTLSQQNYNNKPSNAYAQVIPSNEGTNQSDLGSVTVVYTDGASSNNGYGNARAGYGVYWGENDSRNVSAPLLGPRQTNQRAEIQAVICALEQSLDDDGLLEIRTDSQYVINAITKWSKNWVQNGWRSSNGKEVENRDLFERALDLMNMRKGEVQFSYVPGHSGVHGNERADQLAVIGAQRNQ